MTPRQRFLTSFLVRIAPSPFLSSHLADRAVSRDDRRAAILVASPTSRRVSGNSGCAMAAATRKTSQPAGCEVLRVAAAMAHPEFPETRREVGDATSIAARRSSRETARSARCDERNGDGAIRTRKEVKNLCRGVNAQPSWKQEFAAHHPESGLGPSPHPAASAGAAPGGAAASARLRLGHRQG